MKSRLHRGVALVLVSGPALAQSDDCATAAPIAGAGSFPFTTVGSSDSGAIGTCNNPPSSDVWFRWTTGSEPDYRISICTTDYDAVVALYDGCGGIELACEDAIGCTPSLFDVELEVLGLAPNTDYRIQIDGWQGMQGSGVLEIAALGPPPNDDCAAATPISGTGAFAFDTRHATTDGDPDVACLAFGTAQIESDVWYRWTAPTTGLFELGTCGGTSLDTRIAAYDAQACPPTLAIACDDDACQFQSRLLLPATQGADYLIRLAASRRPRTARGLPDRALGAARERRLRERGADRRGRSLRLRQHLGHDRRAGGLPRGRDRQRRVVLVDRPRQRAVPGGDLRRDDPRHARRGLRRSLLSTVAPARVRRERVRDAERGGLRRAGGQTYTVRVGSFGPVHRSSGTFVIEPPPDPAGDDCAGAVPIAGTGRFPFDNRGATTDGDPDPACAEFSAEQIHDDLWWRWTATHGGWHRIETCGGTALDTKLAVYADQACPPSAPLACDDDTCRLQSRVWLDAQAGAAYLIRLGSFAPGAGGPGDLIITRMPRLRPPR